MMRGMRMIVEMEGAENLRVETLVGEEERRVSTRRKSIN